MTIKIYYEQYELQTLLIKSLLLTHTKSKISIYQIILSHSTNRQTLKLSFKEMHFTCFSKNLISSLTGGLRLD